MIIEVNQLKKNYKNNAVLKGINISIAEPRIIALVGPNGAGKTTLLNCLTNLTSFHEGEIKLLGKNYNDTSLFHEVSYLQDNRILYGNLTGYDHLKFVCDMQKLPLCEIQVVAERVGMEGYLKKRVSNYSLGMKQHLLLAMVIVNKPKLLLMDEPLNGLDPTSSITVRRILLEMYEEGTTIVVSSHNLDEIDRLTDIIYFMKDGELLKESLHDFLTNEYMISVDNIAQATSSLEVAKIPYQLSESKKILFQQNESVSLQSVILQLNQSSITISDIEKRKIGAEKRYQELFEGANSV